MSTGSVASAYRLLIEAVDALETAAGPGAADDDLIAVLPLCRGVARRLDRISVAAAATLDRRGTLTGRGYRNPTLAVMDLLGSIRPSSPPPRRRSPSRRACAPRTSCAPGRPGWSKLSTRTGRSRTTYRSRRSTS